MTAETLVESPIIIDSTRETYIVLPHTIGGGSQAEVYCGFAQEAPDTPLAFKVFTTGPTFEGAGTAASEAAHLSDLQDTPYVVTLHDSGPMRFNHGGDVEERDIIVTSLARGGSFADLLPNTVSLKTKIRLIGEAATGLTSIQSRGILHRDINDGNVLLATTDTSADGQPQRSVEFCDFGAAIRISEIAPNMPVVGAPKYTAPEVILGDSPSVRSDDYSLAVLSWRLLTGKLPFRLPMAAQEKIQAASRPGLPLLYAWQSLHQQRYRDKQDSALSVPLQPELEVFRPILRQALHPDPDKRWSALTMSTALSGIYRAMYA